MAQLPYNIEFESKAQAEFLELPKEISQQFASVFADLRQDPRPPGAKRLLGAAGYRLRRGELRLLYTVDDEKKVVRMYRAGRRREVYSKIKERLFQIRTGAKQHPSP